MLENLRNFFKKMTKKDEEELLPSSGDAAKERLHLVLMQDRANVSVDFLDLMKQEIIDVIKKYIDIDENEMDVRLTNQINEDGTNGAPALYANIPIIAIKNEKKKEIEQKIKEDNLIKENEKSDKTNSKNNENEVKDKTSEINENKNIISDENVDKKEENTENNTNKKLVESKEKKSQSDSEKKETTKKKISSESKKATPKKSTNNKTNK